MVLSEVAYRRLSRLAREGMALRLTARQQLRRPSPICCARCGHRPELQEVGTRQGCPICGGVLED